jgi:hypothetical protein
LAQWTKRARASAARTGARATIVPSALFGRPYPGRRSRGASGCRVTALGRPGLPDDIGPVVAPLLIEDNCWINRDNKQVNDFMASSPHWSAPRAAASRPCSV